MSKLSITIERGNTMTRPAIHPGEILADELDELGISPTELARQINVPANRVSQIIHAKRAITGDTALRLGHWFQTSAAFWLNLQSAYDLRLAQQAAGAEIDALPIRPEQQAPPHQPGLL
jgi:addiction module HigA family antidote